MAIADHVVSTADLLAEVERLIVENKAVIRAAVGQDVHVCRGAPGEVEFQANQFPLIVVWSEGKQDVRGAGCGNHHFVTCSLVATCLWYEPSTTVYQREAEKMVSEMMAYVSGIFRNSPKAISGVCDTRVEEQTIEVSGSEEQTGFVWSGNVAIEPLLLIGGS